MELKQLISANSTSVAIEENIIQTLPGTTDIIAAATNPAPSS